jgi:hypothetical protein
VTTYPLRQPQPPLSRNAGTAVLAEIEPTGLNRHNDHTTSSPGRVHPRVTAWPYPQRSMVDLLHGDPMPDQPPTLTELAEARAGALLARQIDLDWLMAHDDPPDVGDLLALLVNRPAWHRQAACRGADPDLFFPERGTHRPVEALHGAVAVPRLGPRGGVDDGCVGWGRPGGTERACGEAWRDRQIPRPSRICR